MPWSAALRLSPFSSLTRPGRRPRRKLPKPRPAGRHLGLPGGVVLAAPLASRRRGARASCRLPRCPPLPRRRPGRRRMPPPLPGQASAKCSRERHPAVEGLDRRQVGLERLRGGRRAPGFRGGGVVGPGCRGPASARARWCGARPRPWSGAAAATAATAAAMARERIGCFFISIFLSAGISSAIALSSGSGCFRLPHRRRSRKYFSQLMRCLAAHHRLGSYSKERPMQHDRRKSRHPPFRPSHLRPSWPPPCCWRPPAPPPAAPDPRPAIEPEQRPRADLQPLRRQPPGRRAHRRPALAAYYLRPAQRGRDRHRQPPTARPPTLAGTVPVAPLWAHTGVVGCDLRRHRQRRPLPLHQLRRRRRRARRHEPRAGGRSTRMGWRSPPAACRSWGRSDEVPYFSDAAGLLRAASS